MGVGAGVPIVPTHTSPVLRPMVKRMGSRYGAVQGWRHPIPLYGTTTNQRRSVGRLWPWTAGESQGEHCGHDSDGEIPDFPSLPSEESKCHFLHRMHPTIEDSIAPSWGRDLPILAHSCLGIATPRTKNYKRGKSASPLETSRPWVGRMHVVQTPPP